LKFPAYKDPYVRPEGAAAVTAPTALPLATTPVKAAPPIAAPPAAVTETPQARAVRRHAEVMAKAGMPVDSNVNEQAIIDRERSLTGKQRKHYDDLKPEKRDQLAVKGTYGGAKFLGKLIEADQKGIDTTKITEDRLRDKPAAIDGLKKEKLAVVEPPKKSAPPIGMG
jgi:hypothetical protein